MHNLRILFVLLVQFALVVNRNFAFDSHDDDDFTDHQHQGPAPSTIGAHQKSQPKDRILLRDVKSLTFFRNKRTTSRRTHSIHQLSCVGGTAGCKLFTPDLVECKPIEFNQVKGKFDWTCHADISDRVKFNHVEVICEGYDYAEDDYILLGSCGLEFTLDYADSSDYHHQSYFQHLDEHEKKLHEDKSARKEAKAKSYWSFVRQLLLDSSQHIYLIAIFFALVLFSYFLIKFWSKNGKMSSTKKYGQLTSAVLTTKKVC